MKLAKDINIKNKRATYDYAIGDTFTAGIVLTGTDIKSIRLGKASLVDTFCYVERGEVWIKNSLRERDSQRYRYRSNMYRTGHLWGKERISFLRQDPCCKEIP